MLSKTFIVIVFSITVIAGGSYWLLQIERGPGKYDVFVQCLQDRGSKFYGAFWCVHCQNQKALFGNSEKLLPYVECSTANGRGQLQLCKEKNIAGYPTWEFIDGSRETGEVSLEKLAEKTGCELLKEEKAQ